MNNTVSLEFNLSKFDSINVLYGEDKVYHKGDIAVVVLSNLYNRNHERLSCEDVVDLYLKHGEDINSQFEGVYTVFIADFKNKKIYVFQDFFGSDCSVYYYVNKDKLIISDNLKSIIRSENKQWYMNRRTVKQFILRGYCANEETLVSGVYKIPGQKYLVVDATSKAIKLKKYKKEVNSKHNVTTQMYDSVVERQCRACYHEGIATTVSSGYDSNYILYNLNKFSDERKIGFCIGGTTGRNEIPDAQIICDFYGNVDLRTKLVNGSSFDKLPEIVYALEGAVYESGIFLQYELANLVKDNGVDDIILGECADQVLNFEMYHPVHRAISIVKYNLKMLPGRIFKGLHYRPYRTVYDMASYIVIKKSGLLMNYYGINTEYPYMRKEFMKTAQNAVAIGERKKECHKRVIKEVLPEEVTKILDKKPGATELKDLFIGDITLEDIKVLCEKSEFYKPMKFKDQYYGIDNYLKILYLELFKKMFILENEKYLTETYGGYELKEMFEEFRNK